MTGRVRLVNMLMGFLNRIGLTGALNHTLITLGRTSRKARSTPITLAAVDGRRYLVAPYGPVGWVHNIRATGIATLSRGGHDEAITVRELPAPDAAPVLYHYYTTVKITQPYFDVPDDPAVADFVPIATHHPVFRIEE
ncbi:MAG: nitroreductase family deazaflavin-dependent oxidoreductase [Acidimicrobiia bacterium]|nr:nitroreductase family deazaflavin-dependent oxidoreductase [Acidimicrobiia bacterium]NNF08794.1 nitroreductase family deazaflavin-dependent oxidoreductase [Acidimicrobiia bacterium]